MTTQSLDSRAWLRIGLLALAVAVLLRAAPASGQVQPAAASQPVQPPPVPQFTGVGYDTTPRMIDFIPGGTLVDQQPEGWTHLVGKSYPRLAYGDVNQVNELTARMASFIITCILARVDAVPENGETRYQLSRVALGLAVRINGREVIVSPESQPQVAPRMGMIESMVLSRVHDKQKLGRVIARSRTMMLIDTPATMLRGDRHRWVVLRYAIMVEPRTGQLSTLLWVIDVDEKNRYLGLAGPMEWLPPNKVDDCGLHVDAREFTLGVPSDLAFAIVRPPQGIQQFTFPEDLAPIAAAPQLTPPQAEQLETRLSYIFQYAAAAAQQPQQPQQQ